MKKKREFKNIRRFENQKRYTINGNDLLRGKIEFLLSKYGEGETCKISSTILQRVIDDLIKDDKGDAILECSVKRNGVEEKYAILNVEKTMILAKIENGVAELSRLSKLMSSIDLPKESLDLNDIYLVDDGRVNYTLDDFIRDTNSVSTIGTSTFDPLQLLRPLVVCKDGFSLSIQASRYHLCEPNKNNITNYTTFELADIDQSMPELDQYFQKPVIDTLLCPNKYRRYGYVPKELVEEILEKHGGIDKQRTFNETELYKLYRETRGLRKFDGYLDELKMNSDILVGREEEREYGL